MSNTAVNWKVHRVHTTAVQLYTATDKIIKNRFHRKKNPRNLK